jgi:hypothetical protein
MKLAIKISELTLAQEARIIRRYENSKRRQSQWAKEQQRQEFLKKNPAFVKDPSLTYVTASERKQIIKGYLADIAANQHPTDPPLTWDEKHKIIRAKLERARIAVAPNLTSEVEKYIDPKNEFVVKERLADMDRFNLYNHRIFKVRPEARAAHLAYGFLCGTAYAEMETYSYTWPDWDRIQEMVLRHGEEDKRVLAQKFAEWRDKGLQRPTPKGKPKTHPVIPAPIAAEGGVITTTLHVPPTSVPAAPTEAPGIMDSIKKVLGFSAN